MAEAVLTRNGNEVILEVPSLPRHRFAVMGSDDLSAWSWLDRDVAACPVSGMTIAARDKVTVQKYFYRVFPRIENIAFLGDSITNGESNTDGVAFLQAGRLLCVLTRQRLTAVRNPSRGDWDFGWSGFTSQQLLAGSPGTPGVLPVSLVIESCADACIVHVGTNNVSRGQSPETIVASISEIWDQLSAAGIRVIATEISPRGDLTSVAIVDQVNSMMKSEALRRKLLFVPWNRIGRLPDGTADPVFFPDGIHPNAIAQSAKALMLSDYINASFALGRDYEFPSFGSANWITSNPYMTGSSQSSVALGLASGWSYQIPAGGSLSFAKVPSTDGIVDWQEITVVQSENQYNKGYVFMATSATLVAGASYCAVAEIESDDSWDFKEVSVSVANMPFNAKDLYVGGLAGIRKLETAVSPYSGIIRTPSFIAESSSTAVRYFFLNFYGSGKIKVRRAGIHRVYPDRK